MLVFGPAEWKFPKPLEIEALRWQDALTYSTTTGDRAGFELALATLRHRLKRPRLEPLEFDLADRIAAVPETEQIVPPAGTLLTGPAAPESPREAQVFPSAGAWLRLGAAALIGALIAFAATAVF